ncbi:MAG TPA: GAF domain-containing protein [Stellaceae bacterium]|nr:GAF domain-containing protein [Stellaceae bacterium]
MAKRGQALRKARAVKGPAKPAVDLKQEIAVLKRELAQERERRAATSDALTATADVLKAISRSTFDLEAVLDAVAETARRLCGAGWSAIFRRDGDVYRVATAVAFPTEMNDAARHYQSYLEQHPLAPDRGSITGRVALEGRAVHVVDTACDPDYVLPATALGKLRTQLGVPLLREGSLIGVIALGRQKVDPFTEEQIALVTTFANQAVIAIENTRLLTEQREALEQQTATAEVLQVINSSPGNLTPVFDAMLEKAMRLCQAAFGILLTHDGTRFQEAAQRGTPAAYSEFRKKNPLVHGPGTGAVRALEEKRVVQIVDAMDTEAYRSGDPRRRGIVDLGGARTILWVPLVKDDVVRGVFTLYRKEVRPYSDKQIALVQNFAAQAVIAMENARLITETREALEQQTATAEVLQVINSSPGDLAPVFDAMLDKALRLCDAVFGFLRTYDGANFHLAARRGVPPAFAEFMTRHEAATSISLGTLVRGAAVFHIADAAATEDHQSGDPLRRAVVDLGGARTLLAVPLRKDGTLLGAFVIYRQEVRPFSDKQIALLQNFAAQAVIAMENARLLTETREALEQQTATSDVLKIISRSSVDLETVLDTLVETVARLCRADQTGMFHRRDEAYHLIASHGISEEAKEFVITHPVAADRGTLSGRVTLERRAVHIPDVLEDREYTYREGQKITGYRTMLGIPLLREETLIGILHVNRTRVDPFTNKEIELAATFADQAVIAIENARLFDELRERQAELRTTFDNMGDGVAMFGADTRLAAWNRNLQEMLDLPDALLAERPSSSELFRYLAARGEFVSADLEAELSRSLEDTSREVRYERTRPDGRVIEVRRNPVPGGGFVFIYADITERKRAEETIRAARDAAEAALRELQTAQASLVHAQKMAALGQLTAGIAHEIKNPLNFVNNFAGLSVDLLDELKEAAAQAMGALDAGKRAELDETIEMLSGNLEKIAEHGRRADGIVKSMLQHSRGGSGDWQATDLNALVDEALNLAYHGARAQDQSFNITMERDLDRNLAPIEVVPQDVMRVFLNLIGNGFYAANKRSREGDGTFRPVLTVMTREIGDAVEIRVRDNGVGIPAEHREKLFQPFFTTKPTGEGTGLGLSISFEIVTQRHGGTITVESEVGEFTEFTVRLPRRQHPMAGRAV